MKRVTVGFCIILSLNFITAIGQNNSSILIDLSNDSVPLVHSQELDCSLYFEIGWTQLCSTSQHCKLFGDCCPDTKLPENNFTQEFTFDCLSNKEGLKSNGFSNLLKDYYMVGHCPPSTEEELDPASSPKTLCESDDPPRPPVTDNTTGIVYKNEYCALCNGVSGAHLVRWPSEWRCEEEFKANYTNATSLTLETILQFCKPVVFSPPSNVYHSSLLYPLRGCHTNVINRCPPVNPGTGLTAKEYDELIQKCDFGFQDAIEYSGVRFKNYFCAQCNIPEYDPKEIQCIIIEIYHHTPLGTQSPPPSTDEPKPPPFPILLDITGSGQVIVGKQTVVISSTEEFSCSEGHVFDYYTNQCRLDLCSPGYVMTATECVTNCSLIALNSTEYKNITDSVILWESVSENFTIVRFDSNGEAIICSNFSETYTQEVNTSTTELIYGYPEAFSIISYVGFSVDVVACIVVIITYSIFSELHTFFTYLLLNLTTVILLGDAVFLLGQIVLSVIFDDIFCQVLAILLHYLFLCRFIWMSVLIWNITRHMYRASQFIPLKNTATCPHLLYYMLIGWLLPAVIVGVVVTVNYSVPGSVAYGAGGSCWVTEVIALGVSFILPLALSLVFNIVLFTYSVAVIVKISRKGLGKSSDQSQASRNFRAMVTIFSVTGLTWIFGFVPLIDPALFWSWYIFIVLNSTQAVLIFVAYVLKPRVLLLYKKAVMSCCKMEHYETSTKSTKSSDIKSDMKTDLKENHADTNV